MTIGARLKEERTRLGLSQSDFAGLAQTTKKSQIEYEKGATHPNAAYLAAIADAGADVLYILTGEYKAGAKPEPALSADERELLALFRAAPLAVKAAAIGALQAGGAPAVPRYTVTQTIHGKVGQQAAGDIHNEVRRKR